MPAKSVRELGANLAVVGSSVRGVVACGQEVPPVDECEHNGARWRQQAQYQQQTHANLRPSIELQGLALHQDCMTLRNSHTSGKAELTVE